MNFFDFNYTSRNVEINGENLEKKEWRLVCVDYHNFSLVDTSTTTDDLYNLCQLLWTVKEKL